MVIVPSSTKIGFNYEENQSKKRLLANIEDFFYRTVFIFSNLTLLNSSSSSTTISPFLAITVTYAFLEEKNIKETFFKKKTKRTFQALIVRS
jgi:hypothetical protein